MARLSQKQRLMAAIIVTALVVLGGGAGIYLLYDKWQGLETEKTDAQGQYDDIKQKEKMNAKREEDFKKPDYVEGEKMRDRQLPYKSPTGDTDLWLDLNKIRRAYPSVYYRKVEGVVERPGTQLPYTPPPGVRKMPYRVFMRGKFYDIVEYLSQIENGDRIVRLEVFDIKKVPSSASGAALYREDVYVDAAVGLYGFEYEAAAPSSGASPGGAPPR